jgi:23S rRNA-/tRNA-specific pseudouridylate synthase
MASSSAAMEEAAGAMEEADIEVNVKPVVLEKETEDNTMEDDEEDEQKDEEDGNISLVEDDVVNEAIDSSNGIDKFTYTKSMGDYNGDNDDDDDDDDDLYPVGNPKTNGVSKIYHIPANGFADYDLLKEKVAKVTAKAENNNNNNSNDNDSKRIKLVAEDGGDDPSIKEEASASDGPIKEEASASAAVTPKDLTRIDNLTATNVTLPLALMMLDPKEYPSLSRARKACRKGHILLHSGPLPEINPNATFATMKLGKVDSRVCPHDVIGRQVRMSGGFYPSINYKKPPFDLPVMYEDDHMAIVNKPAGVVVYAQKETKCGHFNVRSALPFVLKPPSKKTAHNILRRPQPVHRLDKPTSGLLLVAKTKAAHIALSRQFETRRIKKTYCAILNGIPMEESATQLTTLEAQEMGVDVGFEDYCYKNITTLSSTSTSSTKSPELEVKQVKPAKFTYQEHNDKWQLIDFALEEKSAVTIWRPLAYVPSVEAKEDYLTLVEMKPKSGRYHQLRRHMVRTVL